MSAPGSKNFRILFFSDSHLGFDNGARARIVRRRRNADFEKNFKTIVLRALQGDIDCVIHGGDVFYRSKVMPELVAETFDQLSVLHDHGIPLYMVPGNHERSRIPHPLLAIRPGISIFSKPASFRVEKNGIRLRLSGFPYCSVVRDSFADLYRKSAEISKDDDFHILCIHQAVEGCSTGIHHHVFRDGPDIIPGRMLPEQLDLIVSGHMHKAQVLQIQISPAMQKTLPVLYAGAIERTSFAEREETKGFFLIDLNLTEEHIKTITWNFVQLPVRPMIVHQTDSLPEGPDAMPDWLDREIGGYPRDAILLIQIRESGSNTRGWIPSTESLRRHLPETMNISIRVVTDR